MIVTTLRSLTAVSSMPGEYTRLRAASDITVWSASLSAIVVSTLPLSAPLSAPTTLDVTVPTQALQAALKALRGDGL